MRQWLDSYTQTHLQDWDKKLSKEQKKKLRQKDREGILFEDEQGKKYIIISQEAYDAMNEAFKIQDGEDTYYLLANRRTGIIDQLVSEWTWKSAWNTWQEAWFVNYLDELATKKWYMVVWRYHLHPSPVTIQWMAGPEPSSALDGWSQLDGAPLRMIWHYDSEDGSSEWDDLELFVYPKLLPVDNQSPLQTEFIEVDKDPLHFQKTHVERKPFDTELLHKEYQLSWESLNEYYKLTNPDNYSTFMTVLEDLGITEMPLSITVTKLEWSRLYSLQVDKWTHTYQIDGDKQTKGLSSPSEYKDLADVLLYLIQKQWLFEQLHSLKLPKNQRHILIKQIEWFIDTYGE